MNTITIVTAFFDIGRGDFATYQRSVDKYIEWFERWARIKNKLIVYLQDDYIIKRVEEIRKKFGLLEKTRIIKIDDFFGIESDILNKMLKIENSRAFIEFRKFKDNPENTAKYNYVNLMKSYFINDASKKYIDTKYAAWVDFGFEHGGDVYENAEDYSFEWMYDFGEKINLFSTGENIDDVSVFEMVKNLGPVSFMGALIVIPTKLSEEFWENNLLSANILYEVGFMDDDQLLYVMSYRRNPQLFDIKKSDWFMPIHDYGGSHMKTKQKTKENNNLLKKIKKKVRSLLYGRK